MTNLVDKKEQQRKMLRVDPNSWHYRLYQIWLTQWSDWLGVAKPRRLDLCSYMRALLLWIPLTGLFLFVIGVWMVIFLLFVGGIFLLAAILYACAKQYRDFFKLVWAWIVAKKHKVCPLVEVS